MGAFIELEYLANDNDDNNYEDMIKEIALELGINVDDVVNNYYDSMIHELDNQK